MTLGEFAAPELAQRRVLLEKALHAALEEPAVEAIHRVRTSWRRLEAVGKLLPWLVTNRSWENLRALMKPVMKAAAELRDRDNALTHFEPRHGLHLVVRGQRKLWETEFRSRAEALLPLTLAGRPRLPKAASVDANLAAARILARNDRDLRRERKSLGPQSKSEDWHRFRILIKRHRYALEFFAPLDDAYPDLVAQVKEKQDRLGAVEDAVAAIRVVRAAAPRASLVREELRRLKQLLREKLNELDTAL
jgi:CHAD domain-containing protein